MFIDWDDIKHSFGITDYIPRLNTLIDRLTAILGGLGKGEAGGVCELDNNAQIPEARLPASVLDAQSYQGVWNAATNTPAIPAAASGNRGHYYIVSVAGSTNVDGIASWAAGDWIISDGSAWAKISGGASAHLVTATDTTTPRSLADRHAERRNVCDFGALPGLPTNLEAVQAAIEAAHAGGSPVVYCPGGFGAIYHSGLTLYPDVILTGDGIQNTTLYLANDSNTHAIMVPAADDTGYAERHHAYIYGIKLDCNGSNQSTGDGIHLTDGAAYGGSLVAENLEVTAAKNIGLYVGAHRNVGRLHGFTVKQCGSDGMQFKEADAWSLYDGEVHTNAGEGINNVAAIGLHGERVNVYSNAGRGLRLQPWAQGICWIGGGIDRNQMDGLEIVGDGNSKFGYIFIGTSFGLNSQGTPNTYSQIKIHNVPGSVAVVNPLWTAEGSDPAKYAIEITGTSGPVTLTGEIPTNVYNTAPTNNFSKLLAAGTNAAGWLLNGAANAMAPVLGGVEYGYQDGGYWAMGGSAVGQEVFRVTYPGTPASGNRCNLARSGSIVVLSTESAAGGADVTMKLQPEGTGYVQVGGSTQPVYVAIKGAATGGDAVVVAEGEADAGLKLAADGSGAVTLGGAGNKLKTAATLVDAVDDAAAASAGVEPGQFYRDGSVLMVRVS
jgi:hypothetical protein